MGEPVCFNNSLYVTTVGFVGKIDLDSGVYSWKHGNLYKYPDVFHTFARPEINGSRVCFKEAESTYMTREPKTLIIDMKTGEVE